MIRNKFAARCRCKAWVPAGAGYVVGRRITCGECAAVTGAAEDEERESARGEFEERDIHGFDDW